MTGRMSSASVLVQVAALAALAVIASQTVAFVVVLTAPPPRPAGFSVVTAGDALLGRPARTSDGRLLKRRLSDQPPVRDTPGDPIELAIAAALAQRVGVPPASVHISLQHDSPGAMHRWMAGGSAMRPDPGGPMFDHGAQTFVFTRRAGEPPAPPRRPGAANPPASRPGVEQVVVKARSAVHLAHGEAAAEAMRDIQMITIGDRPGRFSVTTDRLTFAPFSASVKLDDGRWATVQPPRGLIAPWQTRLLASLLISMLILAPLVWLMARRLTRPIRVFAEAAERLGADPDAEPLTPSGPSELRTAIAAFNDMQASLRDHMRKRTQTVAAIAHDLRTPLTRLRFRAEQAPESVRDRMAADIEEMDGLIATAMAYVRGEAQAERHEPLDLAALARDCAAGFSETGAAVSFDSGAPLAVEGDPTALRRAVANLIDNALKFGGAARVSAFAHDGAATVTIDDDGPGLPESELDAAFEPFHRGERSRNRETGGAGLGLAVARQAARAAGGEVVLVNREGGGLMARLTLPLSTSAAV